MSKKKVGAGRPTKYKKEYCEMMIDFFNRDVTRIVETEEMQLGKKTIRKERLPNYPPMFGKFARDVLKINHCTLLEWVKKYDEFAKAYNECKVIQREHIIIGCLMGVYNGNFGRFTMKNISDWRDNVDTHISTDRGGLKLAYSLESKK